MGKPLEKSEVESKLRNHVLRTYLSLRLGLIVLGVLLPLVLWIGGVYAGIPLQPSISQYYHTALGDVFVGFLWAVAAILYLYKGFSEKENYALNLAAIFLIGVSLIPTSMSAFNYAKQALNFAGPVALRDGTRIAGAIDVRLENELTSVLENAEERDKSIQGMNPLGAIGPKVHGICAILFFILVAYVCFFRSGDTFRLFKDPANLNAYQRRYAIIAAALILVPLAVLALEQLDVGDRFHLVFWLEAVGIWIFAIYWLVKTFEFRLHLKDKKFEDFIGEISSERYERYRAS